MKTAGKALSIYNYPVDGAGWGDIENATGEAWFDSSKSSDVHRTFQRGDYRSASADSARQEDTVRSGRGFIVFATHQRLAFTKNDLTSDFYIRHVAAARDIIHDVEHQLFKEAP